MRAFKHTCVLGYEMPWNQTEARIDCHILLTEDDMAAKCAALHCYRSQAHRPYMQPAFIRGLAAVRGAQAGAPWAEGYETLRWRW